jgi:hypothetical protein
MRKLNGIEALTNTLLNCKRAPILFGILAASLLSLHAQAAVDSSWDFRSSSLGVSSGTWTSTATGGSYSFLGSDSSTTVTISGWTANNDNNSGDNTVGTIQNRDSKLIHYGGGLGMNKSSGDDHEIDNFYYDEFVVFEFSEPVSIASYSFGWVDTDADSTLLAYTDDPEGPNTNAELGLTNSDYVGDLVANGWTAIGHYPGNDTAPQTIDPSGDTANVFSSYWIIGAYLSDITPLLAGGTDKKDAFKLASVGVMKPGDTPPSGETPTPGSVPLIALGLLLLYRKKYK